MKPQSRDSPLEISKDDFKKIGYGLVDAIAEFLDTIGQRPVTTGESPVQIQQLINSDTLPEEGRAASELMAQASDLLLNHSLLNGHPKFMGYITSSAAPLGALADLLAAAVNPNVGANVLSPMATAIEKQTVSWLSQLIGYAPTCGGLLVSGGNMANFTAFLAARTAKAPKDLKEKGLTQMEKAMVFYCSKATHTWIEKAATLFGHGTSAICWIDTDKDNRMDTLSLETAIKKDIEVGRQPFLVVGNAGDVSTGVVDPLRAIASICKTYDLWFHIDGAYGIPAAIIPDQKERFEGIQEADSIALDPHKWLYSPLEAGCTLVKDPNHLIATYSSHPVYYNFNANNEALNQNYYEYGFQNSRGFRALKVWMTLQQVGRQGYVRMIGEDIRLSKLFFDLARQHPELEAMSQNLSITTLRYVPIDLQVRSGQNTAYLNTLNESLLNQLQQAGEVFLSNAVVRGHYCLRGCIVNFRTSVQDIGDIIEIIVREGRKMHQILQKPEKEQLS
jgi:aromatic-L-amino-acid/L-tryptophan decarboxylase